MLSVEPHSSLSQTDSFNKLLYLKKICARKVLEGLLYRNDDEAYSDAFKRLNKRSAQPFMIQRAFRSKLTNWPKIHPNNAEGLLAFTDFLLSCLEIIPHVKGIDILNDCEENGKLVQKLEQHFCDSTSVAPIQEFKN